MNLSTESQAGFLCTDRLVKRFDAVAAVDDVSLAIRKGEIFALLGPSGCGKSTLLRMLAGFEAPSAGAVLLDGVNIASMPPYERPINMMFQSYALFPHLSVWDNIAFGLRREGLPKAEISERFEGMLRLLQLTAFAKRKPHQLSGGQQQRVALARSLAKRPQLLLLDEPLAGAGPEETERLIGILRALKGAYTILLVEHDMQAVFALADRISVLALGRVIATGAPDAIRADPAVRAAYLGEEEAG